MTDKQKQALLLITRLYNENKIGDGELCLLHDFIFIETNVVPYIQTYPMEPLTPKFSTPNTVTSTSDDVPDDYIKERYYGD